MDVDDNNLWYVRDFLPSLIDSSFDPDRLGRYLGSLNGLGLMDLIDGQASHYCLNRREDVVNIDPDFVTFTRSQDIVQRSDWADFVTRLPIFRPTWEEGEKVRTVRLQTIERVQRTLEDKNLKAYPILGELETYPALRDLTVGYI